MIHATIWAIQKILSNKEDMYTFPPFPSMTTACGWRSASDDEFEGSGCFSAESAELLMNGLSPKQSFPTCPECAVLVDLAIQLRAIQKILSEESQSIL